MVSRKLRSGVQHVWWSALPFFYLCKKKLILLADILRLKLMHFNTSYSWNNVPTYFLSMPTGALLLRVADGGGDWSDNDIDEYMAQRLKRLLEDGRVDVLVNAIDAYMRPNFSVCFIYHDRHKCTHHDIWNHIERLASCMHQSHWPSHQRNRLPTADIWVVEPCTHQCRCQISSHRHRLLNWTWHWCIHDSD